jgi:hypothetical protein
MLKLTSAQVLADGLAVRLRFEGGLAVGQPVFSKLADDGDYRTFDYLAPKQRGCLVSIAGQTAEVVGIEPEPWNMPLPWVDPPDTGGTIPAGKYVFLLTITDANGNELFTGPPMFGYSNEEGIAVPDQGQLTFHWRQHLTPGQTLRIYAASTSPAASNLKLVGTCSEVGACCYTLTAFNPDGPLWQPRSICLAVTCLVTNPIPIHTPVTVTATQGLVDDEQGTATEAVFERPVENESLVLGTGFLATVMMETSQTFYISSSRGDDVTGNGSLGKPFKTKGRADQVAAGMLSPRFCFLRGDTFPYEPWRVAHWGEHRYKPALYESYWNYAYGTDPGRRPVLLDDPDATTTSNPWFQQGENGKAYYGRWPYQYFRGLEFRREWNKPARNTWPTNTPNDAIIFSDCLFDNICLVPYGSAQHIAPIGCMFHRCTIQNARGGDQPNDPHVSGFFTGHCGDWLFSQTAFVRNGWRGSNCTNNDQFNHDGYLSAMCRHVVFHSGWLIDGCLSGLQMRGGGVCAYSIFLGNPSHLSSNDTHMFYKCVFQDVGLYSHIASGTHSFGPTAIHDFCITVGTSGIDQTRNVVNTYDGLYAFHHDSTGPYVYADLRVRHETAVDAGGLSLGSKMPGRHLDVSHNLVVNRPGTGVDKNGHGLKSLSYVGADSVPTGSVWGSNAFQPSGEKTDFAWLGKPSTPGYRDVILADVKFANAMPADYIRACVRVIQGRSANLWANQCDGRVCYQQFAAAYTPVNITRANDGDYFGASNPTPN